MLPIKQYIIGMSEDEFTANTRVRAAAAADVALAFAGVGVGTCRGMKAANEGALWPMSDTGLIIRSLKGLPLLLIGGIGSSTCQTQGG